MTVDTLIIGSGVAGVAIAKKLLDDNPAASILMLEASSKVVMRDFALYQNYLITKKLPYKLHEDEPYPARHQPGENNSTGSTVVPLNGSRLLIYGGSTVHWGGWSFRLKPEDFRLHTNTGQGIDWPIDYTDLESYYGEAEHYIGVSGDSNNTNIPRTQPFPFPAFPYTLEDQPMLEALIDLEYQHNPMPIARYGIASSDSTHAPCQTTGTCKYCPFGARFVAANYLDDMIRFNHYPNFEVRQNAIVDRISMTDKETAEGVYYYDKTTGEEVQVKANRIVVAAGAVESAKLLLRSKSKDWKDGLGNDHDLVGRNLITHPYFIFEAEMDKNDLNMQVEMNFPTLVSRHFDSEEEQAKGKFILLNSPSSPSFNPYNHPVAKNTKLNNIQAAMQQGLSREEIDELVKGSIKVQIHGIIETFSEPQNYVKNYDVVNHLGLIETTVHYNQPKDFDKRMEEVQAAITTIFEKMGAKNVKQTMLSWRADHAACLTRMSDSPEKGVVDKDMKVFGTNNVYICSNSSFSSLGAINPTLTLAALSLRLGDHLNNNNQKNQ